MTTNYALEALAHGFNHSLAAEALLLAYQPEARAVVLDELTALIRQMTPTQIEAHLLACTNALAACEHDVEHLTRVYREDLEQRRGVPMPVQRALLTNRRYAVAYADLQNELAAPLFALAADAYAA